MPNRKNRERRELLDRDNWKCGIHIEGCRKLIEKVGDCTTDHIIPRHVFTKLDLNLKEYNRRWNKQPMHRECNTRRSTGYNRGWPTYDCECHFLYIHNGNAYIYAQEDNPQNGEWAWKCHPFVKEVVSSNAGHEMSIGIILAEQWVNRTRTHLGLTRDPVRGHNFPYIHPDVVNKENVRSLAQTGLLHRACLWAGQHLDSLKPLITHSGNRLEETYLILPDVLALGLDIAIPLTTVLSRGALLTWECPPLDGPHWRLLTPKPRAKLPLNQTIKVWWDGGHPPPTTDSEVAAGIIEWFRSMNIPATLEAKPATRLINFREEMSDANRESLLQFPSSPPTSDLGRMTP